MDRKKVSNSNIGSSENSSSEETLLNPITVRFSKDALDAIRQVAEMNGTSMGDIVRLCVDNRLIKYLQSVLFIDYDQGQDFQNAVFGIADELQKIRWELHKIGVNYNQEVKVLNEVNKRGGKVVTPAFNSDSYINVYRRLKKVMDDINRTAGVFVGLTPDEDNV